jgi:translation initiation factor 1 (eIF-1/SUI1)
MPETTEKEKPRAEQEKFPEKMTKATPESELQSVIASFTQVTLHRQSAGRAGRTVIMVTIKPPQMPVMLDALTAALRRGLGCGAHVEQDRVALQGDIAGRAQEWFVRKGARRVIKGN